MSFKKIISLICILAIIFSLFAFGFSFSAYADVPGLWDIIDYWDLVRFLERGENNIQDPIQALGIMRENGSYPGCSSSSDGSHYFQGMNPLSPVTGFHLSCIYCGLPFSDYAQSAYEDTLASNNLSGTGYDNTGGLIWYPTVSDLREARFYYYSNGYFNLLNNSNSAWSVIASNSSFLVTYASGSSCSIQSPRVEFKINYPLSGQYTQLVSSCVSGTFSYTSSKNTTNYPFSANYTQKILSTQYSYLNTYVYFSIGSSSINGGSCTVYLPVFRVVPASNSSAPPSQQFYTVINNINTTTFNLATVENNQISNVYENTTVINNNNTTFTLPGGSSYPIDSWSFDFDNDRYTLVVLDGELEIPVTVQFGVDDLTIDFDGDTYTYKYVTEAAPHVHTWELTSSTDPTCTGSGSKTYTCSGCNDVRTETVPALGHDWQLISSVEDHYEADLAVCACGDCGSTNVSLASGGENYFTSEEIGVVCDDCGSTWTILGSFVPGYEVYQCSRCQEEKTVSFGDPVDNSASGFWAWLRIWLENFKTWLGEKLDELLGRENNIIFEPVISPDIQITIPTPDIGFQYADEEGEPDVWHPSDLKEKFAFWADVKDIGTGLYASVQAGGEAPELIIHLGEANSPYGFHYGGDEYALDLSWYGPYKPTVDSITGGFLWLLYLYGVFKNLPNILSGVGMVDNRVQDIQSGTKGGRRRD